MIAGEYIMSQQEIDILRKQIQDIYVRLSDIGRQIPAQHPLPEDTEALLDEGMDLAIDLFTELSLLEAELADQHLAKQLQVA